MKKKTYIFDPDTVEILNTLKEELGKKETQIIREALRLYFESRRNEKKLMDSVNDLVEKIDEFADRISDLSYRLGRCEERNRVLEEELKRLRRS